MQLPRQAARISRIGKNPGYQHRIFRYLLAVLPQTGRTRVSSGQKAAPAGRAHRTLTECIYEGNPGFHEFVEIRGPNDGITQSGDRVEALLIRADPENVGGCFHHLTILKLSVRAVKLTFNELFLRGYFTDQGVDRFSILK